MCKFLIILHKTEISKTSYLNYNLKRMFCNSKTNFNILVITIFFCGTANITCNKINTPTFVTTINKNSIPKILALGDSYTIGQSVNEDERFPNKTISILKSNGINVKYPSKIIAQTGWTTQSLLNEIAANSNSLTPPYDIVTLLIGVNNQYQHLDTGVYRNEFTACLLNAMEYSGNRKNRVFVLSIPDYGATPFGSNNAEQIGLEIDQYNAINKQVSLQMGVSYIDITPSSRMAATDVTLIASDGLHPSGKEYLKWANMLVPKMLPLLQ
jgi:lysophospholipase L1-like esterase